MSSRKFNDSEQSVQEDTTFWGLHLSKGLKYSRIVSRPFCISAATLDTTTVSKDDIITVVFEDGVKEFLLCNLSLKHGVLQVPLNLQFSGGERIAFSLTGGNGDVYLTGYNISIEDDSLLLPDEDEFDVDEEDSDTDEEVPTLVTGKRKRELNISELNNSLSVEAKKAKVQNGLNQASPSQNKSQNKKVQDKKQSKNSLSQSPKIHDLLSNGLDQLSSDEEDEDFVMGEEEEEEEDGEEEEEEDDDDDVDDNDNDDDDEEDDDEDDDDDDDNEEDDNDESSEEDEEEKQLPQIKTPQTKKIGTPTPPSSIGKTPMRKNQQSNDNKKLSTPGKQLQTPKSTGKQTDTSKSALKPTETPKSAVKPTETPKSKKKNKQEKTPNASKQEPASPQLGGKSPKCIKAGGLVCEDIKQGTGAEAKLGKYVSVYYEGRLKNGKVFDKTQSGQGFKFLLGGNEVIKAWDVGVAGMKVGGKRKLTCPPNTAYGKKGAPPSIPPNAFLVFDVELRAVH